MPDSTHPADRAPGVVRIRDLTFRYRGGVTALYDVSASWPKGLVALLGPNGAGKTTLLSVITGGLRADSGEVTVSGSDGSRGSRAIGYLPQEASWPGQFTVTELLTYLAWTRGLPRARRASAVAEAIARVDLTAHRHDRLGRLSGGQRRRAMLAQAVLDEPPVLILDEPTTGFDPVQRVGFRELVAGLTIGRTVVVSTHLVEDVEAVADWVCVLKEGRVAFDGPKAELVALGRPDRSTASPLEGAFLRIVL
jgi:ABC-2 type transport system ATP-binding protein